MIPTKSRSIGRTISYLLPIAAAVLIAVALKYSLVSARSRLGAASVHSRQTESILEFSGLSTPFDLRSGAWKVTNGYNSDPSFAHGDDNYNRWALDFVRTDKHTAGAAILAAHDGVVVFSGYDEQPYNGSSLGWLVQVEDEHGQYATWYAHLSEISVDVGDQVRRGEQVGLAGNSGLCEGEACATHLHFVFFSDHFKQPDTLMRGTRRSIPPEPLSGCTDLRYNREITRDCALPETPRSLCDSGPLPVGRHQATRGSVTNDIDASDTYCAELYEGEAINVRVTALGDDLMDPQVGIEAPNGSFVGVPDSIPCLGGCGLASTSFIPSQTGTYVIRVLNEWGAGGEYAVRVDWGRRAHYVDVNRDCYVNRSDSEFMRSRVHSEDPDADINMDQIVNAFDITMVDRLVEQVGSTSACPASPGFGPEPTDPGPPPGEVTSRPPTSPTPVPTNRPTDRPTSTHTPMTTALATALPRGTATLSATRLPTRPSPTSTRALATPVPGLLPSAYLPWLVASWDASQATRVR